MGPTVNEVHPAASAARPATYRETMRRLLAELASMMADEDMEAEDEDELMKADFSSGSWSTPEASLSPEAFCSVCLLDNNAPGAEKVKAKCYFPVKSKPGGPYNKAALRNAAARLNQANISSADKAKVKGKLARLMRQAGIETSLDKTEAAAEEVNFTAEVELVKQDDELRVSYGVAYPFWPLPWRDSQKDRMTPEEIRKMAHDFMLYSQRYDLHHRELNVSPDQAVVVESYLAPVDLDIPLPDGTVKRVNKGSWIVATHYPDPEVWQRVKKGELGAYSIRGRGTRKPVT